MAIKCKVCDREFSDNSGFGNHIKAHPDVVAEYKEIVCSLFNSNLFVEDIKKKHNIPLSSSWIGGVWRDRYGREKTRQRISKTSSISLNKQYAKGRKKTGGRQTAKETENKIKKSFNSNVPMNKLAKRFNVSEPLIRKIWKVEGHSAKDLNERFKKINNLQYVSGERKSWSEGLTANTDFRVRQLTQKGTITKIRKNLERGIFNDHQFLNPLEKSDFKRNRKIILKKYKETCWLCAKKNSRSVHHIIPFRISKCNALSNLVCLCKTCHGELHGRARRLEMQNMSFDKRCDIYTGEFSFLSCRAVSV